MISIPVASHDTAFKSQLDLFWSNHKTLYKSEATQKAHAIVVSQNYPNQAPIKFDEWGIDIPFSVVNGCWCYFDYEKYGRALLPINIQIGLWQILELFDDEEVLELLDCDMFHLKKSPESKIKDDELVVCDAYENWHLKSTTSNIDVLTPFLKNKHNKYNGGFVPIIGKAKTFKKIIYEWIDLHVKIYNNSSDESIRWWSGMYALQAACSNLNIKMTAANYCYIPGYNNLEEQHYIAHYCCDNFFDKRKLFYNKKKLDYKSFPENQFYESVTNWMRETKHLDG
jgi:hypothetical protein